MRHTTPVLIVLVAFLGALLIAGGARAVPRPQEHAGDVVEPGTANLLVDEVRRLQRLVTSLRSEAAHAKLEAAEAKRELEDLRRFVNDHERFGDDFERYEAVREIADRRARAEAAEANRQRIAAQREERRARRAAARAERELREGEENRQSRYREAGFSSLGLEVWTGRMAYAYATRDSTGSQVDYDPIIGLYYRPVGSSEIDYGKMTISGSVLNSADEVRNLGIAITFFDEDGNQVGGEVVQVNNARPNVPYPFTSTLEMALSRPFASSSAYVLYADPVATE